MIKEYIEPLLAPEQPPRMLYVVGHSFGAGIATMTACYFLTEFNRMTAIGTHERQVFDKLLWGLVTSTIFVRC